MQKVGGSWVLALVFSAPLISMGCSLVLDFDQPITSSDAGFNDARADPDGPPVLILDAMPSAACLALEPNDRLEEPIAITAMTYSAAICPASDLDFYSFDLPADADLRITLTFDNASNPADLNLTLYDEVGTVIAASTGTEDIEEIIHGPTTGNAFSEGAYRVEVVSMTPNSTKDYSLTLAITVP